MITTEAETTAPRRVRRDEGPRALADIHPRMPLMLTPDRWDAWLDPATTDPDEVRELLTPPPAGLLRAYPVGTAVSNVRNNGPELLEELPAPGGGDAVLMPRSTSGKPGPAAAPTGPPARGKAPARDAQTVPTPAGDARITWHRAGAPPLRARPRARRGRRHRGPRPGGAGRRAARRSA